MVTDKALNAKVPLLMGSSEVSEVLEVEPSNLDRVAGLPPAVPWSENLKRGRLWRADVVRRFAAKRRRYQRG